MSHNSINEYTKDFNFFQKCLFEKGDLSMHGYELKLIKFYQDYLDKNANFLEKFLKASPYLPHATVENILALLPCIIDIDKYVDQILNVFKQNTEVLKVLITKDDSIADEILQIADHLNCLSKGLAYEVFSDLIPTLVSLPTWLKDYGLTVISCG